MQTRSKEGGVGEEMGRRGEPRRQRNDKEKGRKNVEVWEASVPGLEAAC